jgi:hypothetical protein
METVLCAISWNKEGWTGPLLRNPEEPVLGQWVKEHGWAGEDWVFATDKAQLLKGRLYSYAQGNPSQERVDASKGRFNVFFYSKDEQGCEGLVGAYRNARYVSDDERADRWQRLKAAKITKRRADQIRQAFGHAKATGKGEAAQFLELADVRWIVRADDVLVFDPMLPFAAPSWHPGNAHRSSELSTEVQCQLGRLLDAGDPGSSEATASGFPLPSGPPEAVAEGRQRQRTHLVRERSSKLAQEFRASRLNLGPPRHFACEACDQSYLKALGGHALDVFDVHHQVPLAKAPKGKQLTDPKELCILCATCHRLAHASGLFTVSELRDFLKNPK